MNSPRLVLLTGHGAAVEAVAFSPDGTTLATCGRDHLVLLWDVPSGTLRAHLEGHRDGVRYAAFSPDGTLLATADWYEQVRLWDAQTGKWLGAFPGLSGPLAFTPEPGYLIALRDAELVLLDYESGGVLRTVSGAMSTWYRTITLAADASAAADRLSDDERELVIWDLPSGEERLRSRLPEYLELSDSEARDEGLAFRKFQTSVNCLALSPQGRQLAAGGSSTLWLCDGQTGSATPLSGSGHRGSHSLAFSGDGRRLAAGSGDGAIRIWAVDSGTKELQFFAHDGWVSALAFSLDGGWIASGGHDMAVAIWNAPTGYRHRRLHGQQSAVRSLAYSPNGKLLAAGLEDGTVRLWSTRTGRLRHTLETRQPWVSALAFSADGFQLFAASSNGYFLDCAVESWSMRTGEPGLSLDLARGYIDSLAILPAAGTVAVSHHSQQEQRRQATTRVWDPETGVVLHELEGTKAAVSPDGLLLATTLGIWNNGTIRLWDTRTGEPVRDLHPAAKPDSHDSLCFSPDSCKLAVGFNGCGVGLWDVATGEQLWEGRTERDALSSCAFSPDGSTIAFGGSYDKAVVLWDAHGGFERLQLTEHTNPIRAVAFSPDGSRLASASTDGTVKVWSPTTGRLLATLRQLQPVDDEAPEEWIAYTPSGHYAGSEGVHDFIRWKVGEELLPAEAFREEFHRPERVAEALRGASEASAGQRHPGGVTTTSNTPK